MKMPFWPNPTGYRDIDFGLTRVVDLLERLNNPHLKIPPTIHFAGTNGKGSTLSFLQQIFVEAGLKTHTYTSPHLVNFNERIVLANQEISDDFLNQCLLECKIAAEKSPQINVTFFEGITVAAFLAFSKVEADILLLETGMGGRLDATNVLPKVLASIITPISFDHTEFLGKTLKEIAFEKGGIIKKNCQVFVAKQKSQARQTLENQALMAEAKIFFFNCDWKIKKQKNGFLFAGFNQKIFLPKTSLLGEHQIDNAALAVAVALNQKQFLISQNHIKAALQKTFWRARLQKIESGKFHKILPANFELYLDGSHNLQGAATIKKFLKNQKQPKKFVIFSMLQDKDCVGFLKKISDEVEVLISLTIANETKSRFKEDIQKIAQNLGINALTATDFMDAFTQILAIHNSDEAALIMVCGSLYLAGDFLAQN
jgi:dihydrofolate synthase/folylpolyglutamate synthase